MIGFSATIHDMGETSGPDEYLTTSELAGALRVHVETVRRWVRAGRIEPTVRTPGGHPRWHLSDVERQLGQRPDQQ